MRDDDRMMPRPERAARYVDISTTAIIRTALERSLSKGKPSLVIGPPGCGKSAAIAELMAQHEAVGRTVTAAHHNTSGIYRMLLDAYDRPEPARGTLHELERRVYSEIPAVDGGDYIAPLILDEYQGIEPLALRELLKVQETLRFALVLVGNAETLAERGRADQQIAMQQIRLRFGYRQQIEGLLDSDFDTLADEWLVEDDADTRGAVAAYGRGYSLHQLTMLLADARELAAIGPTRLEHLRAIVALDNHDRLSVFSAPVASLKARRAAS